jgi:hypothetical protein
MGTSGASLSELRKSLAGHGAIGQERIVQTLVSLRCADWLRRAARATLLVIALSFFAVPGTAVSAMVSADGVWLIDGTGAAVQQHVISSAGYGASRAFRRGGSAGSSPSHTRHASGPRIAYIRLCSSARRRGPRHSSSQQ